MKASNNFGIVCFLLVVVQILICNYFHFSVYVTVSILPAIVLCIPLSKNTFQAMLIAFVCGLATDVFAEGVWGLNALSAVPVALLRNSIIRIAFGEEIVVREDAFSFKKNGAVKISLALLLAEAVFFIVYIAADGAGTRPLWFDLSKGAASIAASFVMSMIAVNIISPSKNND